MPQVRLLKIYILQRRVLPIATVSIDSYKAVKSLTALSEHEQRLKSLIASTGDPELVALQVVFKNLVETTRSQVRIVTTRAK